MSKPTLEQYEKAKQNCSWLRSTIAKVKDKKNELIDKLVEIRQDETRYLELLEEEIEIICLYESYEKIERGECGDG